MARTLVILVVMYCFAGACLLLSRWLTKDSWPAKINAFVGRSLGIFATGIVFLVAYSMISPQRSTPSSRNAAAITALAARVDSLALRIDSLSRRIP